MKAIEKAKHCLHQQSETRSMLRHRSCATAQRHTRNLAGLVEVALGASSLLSKTTGRGTISGTIAGPTGARIVNAQVRAICEPIDYSCISATNSSGYLQVNHRDPGGYPIHVLLLGVRNLLLHDGAFATGGQSNIPIALKRGRTSHTTARTADVALLCASCGKSSLYFIEEAQQANRRKHKFLA